MCGVTSFPDSAPFRLGEMSPRPRPRRRWLLPVVIGGVLLLAAGGFLAWRLTASTVDPNVAACREAVARNLVAPATAKYSAEKVGSTEDANGGTYPTVDGVVDAQNAAGAMVRQRFHCTLNADHTVRNGALSDWP